MGIQNASVPAATYRVSVYIDVAHLLLGGVRAVETPNLRNHRKCLALYISISQAGADVR